MPTLGFHTPEDSPIAESVRARAAASKQSVSSYVREVVLMDLAGGRPADAMSPTILVDLSRRLLGELDASRMAMAMEGKDQRQKLRHILERALVEEFDLDLNAVGYVKDGAPSHIEARISEVATLAGENFRRYIERQLRHSSRDHARPGERFLQKLQEEDKRSSQQESSNEGAKKSATREPRK